MVSLEKEKQKCKEIEKRLDVTEEKWEQLVQKCKQQERDFNVKVSTSVQIKWSSGRPDAQNCGRTTWTSQQVIRGTTRLTSYELELNFENLFHLFLRA